MIAWQARDHVSWRFCLIFHYGLVKATFRGRLKVRLRHEWKNHFAGEQGDQHSTARS